jgi:phytoene/squalene synthetase/geranylgeranyl pyrophosphate synthase
MGVAGPDTSLREALDRVEAGLATVSRGLEAEGMPALEIHGGLIRPLVGWAVASGMASGFDQALWMALGAVQLAHEASLVHDDILDGAAERRGQATTVATSGIGGALVLGDHLLTSAYRLAALTDSPSFTRLFARAVERTVAGEIRQAKCADRVISRTEYEQIVIGKSGELLGCAFAAGHALRNDPRTPEYFEVGRRLGLAYQMLDDFLDYMPADSTGKPPFQDYANRLWTWPLFELVPAGFDEPVEEIARRFHDASGGPSIARRCLDRLDEVLRRTQSEIEHAVPDQPVFRELITEWSQRAHRALASAGTAVVRSVNSRVRREADQELEALLASEEWTSALRRYARSFSFAARWFPAAQRRRTADVYAVCRFTDEIVDRPASRSASSVPQPGPSSTRRNGANTGVDGNSFAVGQNPDADRTRALLDAWSGLCRAAWNGTPSGVDFVDRAMRDAREAGVPFELFEDLVAGVAMDLAVTRYETWSDLGTYTWRVASVVGLWLTRLFGVHDDATLERAAALGHAMQLTNILRDVGEDLDRDRIYVPATVLRDHGIRESDLFEMRRTGRILPAWKDVVEEVMTHAEAAYRLAFEAMPRLPVSFRRPVAVAASVYRGIHDEIRRNGHDNLTRRAHTSSLRKLVLAATGLARLRHPARTHADRRADEPTVPSLDASARLRPKAIAAQLTGRAVAVLLALNLASVALPDRASSQNPPDSTAAVRTIVMDRIRTLDSYLAETPDDLHVALERVAALWLLGVDEEDAVKQGIAGLDTIASRWSDRIEPGTRSLMLAYRGGLETLRGKHAFWPHDKVRHVRAGFSHLDEAVRGAPDNARIRYVRLMSGYYLPGFFGRSDEVRADFDALGRLLPDARESFPPDVFPAVVRFVLSKGDLSDDVRSRLELALVQ